MSEFKYEYEESLRVARSEASRNMCFYLIESGINKGLYETQFRVLSKESIDDLMAKNHGNKRKLKMHLHIGIGNRQPDYDWNEYVFTDETLHKSTAILAYPSADRRN